MIFYTYLCQFCIQSVTIFLLFFLKDVFKSHSYSIFIATHLIQAFITSYILLPQTIIGLFISSLTLLKYIHLTNSCHNNLPKTPFGHILSGDIVCPPHHISSLQSNSSSPQSDHSYHSSATLLPLNVFVPMTSPIFPQTYQANFHLFPLFPLPAYLLDVCTPQYNQVKSHILSFQSLIWPLKTPGISLLFKSQLSLEAFYHTAQLFLHAISMTHCFLPFNQLLPKQMVDFSGAKLVYSLPPARAPSRFLILCSVLNMQYKLIVIIIYPSINWFKPKKDSTRTIGNSIYTVYKRDHFPLYNINI